METHEEAPGSKSELDFLGGKRVRDWVVSRETSMSMA